MVSELVKNIVPSVTGELKNTIIELQSAGVDIINLTSGEPDFRTPDNIVAAAIKAMERGQTKYTVCPGIKDLREAILKKFKDDNGLEYGLAQIGVATGAKQAIYNAILACVNPGDEILVPSPCYVSYTEQIKLARAVPVLVPLEGKQNYALDVALFEKHVTSKSRMIIINSPNNPTGRVYGKDELKELVDFAERHKLMILSDEIYEKLVFDDNQKFISAASLNDYAFKNTIVVNGVSKAYSMTGWRIGYSAAPEPIAKGMLAILGHVTYSANSIAQYAALEALTGPQESVEIMRLEFAKRCEYVMDRLAKIKGIICRPAKGAFYAFPDISSYYGKKYDGKIIGNSVDMCKFLLEKAHVAFVPGSGYFDDRCLRISYAYPMETIKEGLDRFETSLDLLK